MAQKTENRVTDLELKVAALEAAFSRLNTRPASEYSLSDIAEKVHKLSGEIMALKARMGKKEYA